MLSIGPVSHSVCRFTGTYTSPHSLPERLTTGSTFTFFQSVAIWNSDHDESNLASNAEVTLNFDWNCRAQSYTITLTHFLGPLDSHPVPDWVFLDSVNQKLVLKTPLVASAEQFSFSLKTKWQTEASFKSFYLTVFP
jgi:hypothetical protein